ncbi:pseudouridine synthase [Propionispora hippei]|uniref:Pseudouridine synthase n=1 Tax=Propionispora hippei DSM 15287 TaxID=1123003 RepID=A0A1M6N3G4_9FIRM|nr:pseudouridine synthase [Propionispora hippei]SHJ90240.1 23S rRNA pseudouridine2605 synthase [Propionispora hippei DSM 15287]
MAERLQKIISQAGIASRREAEKLITAGRVSVNGVVTTELGTKVEPRKARIAVDGKLIASEKPVYVVLYKPKGVITSRTDPQGRKTVTELVADIPERVYPVGRLDYNTEGLLLLTNDGELTNGLLHPSRHIYKTYIVKVASSPAEEKLDRLRVGIQLEEGKTAPAKVDIVDYDRERDITALEVTIHEGKNRQIRRMFEAIGYPVKNLKRVKFAFLTLEGLRRGQFRYLTDEEILELKKYAGK